MEVLRAKWGRSGAMLTPVFTFGGFYVCAKIVTVSILQLAHVLLLTALVQPDTKTVLGPGRLYCICTQNVNATIAYNAG